MLQTDLLTLAIEIFTIKFLIIMHNIDKKIK